MKAKSFFWGSIFISLGIYFLLKNIGIYSFHDIHLIKLWPLILILWGIAIFNLPNWLKFIFASLSGILVSVLIISLINLPSWNIMNIKINNSHLNVDNEDFETDSTINYQKLYEDYQVKFKKVEFNFDGGAGEFKIGGKTDKLYFVNAGGMYSKINSKAEDSICKINYEYILDNLDIDNQSLDRFSSISLNENPYFDINFNVGASKVNLDLVDYRINLLNVSAGASDIKIRVGNKQENSEINLDVGVSKVVLEIPRDSGCRINSSTGLSKNIYKDFIEKENGIYQTENFDSSKNKINININGGLSKFKVIRN